MAQLNKVRQYVAGLDATLADKENAPSVSPALSMTSFVARARVAVTTVANKANMSITGPCDHYPSSLSLQVTRGEKMRLKTALGRGNVA